MNNKIIQFYKILYNHELAFNEFIEFRSLGENKQANKWFVKNIEELNFENVPQFYHGIFTRFNKKSHKKDIAFSHVVWLDIDFHNDAFNDLKPLKTMMIKIFKEDYILSQYIACLDTGRGLHFYYKIPYKIDKTNGQIYLNNLYDYASNLKVVKDYVDPSVKEVARIMRAPGTINIKTNTVCEVIEINQHIVNDGFMYLLKEGMQIDKTPQYGVTVAAHLIGLDHILIGDQNQKCPLIDHGSNDLKHSFRYFPDTDTFWCWKCSPANNKHGNLFNGLHLLNAMNRKDMIPNLKSQSSYNNESKYTLCKNGHFIQHLPKNQTRLVCDFHSANMIESNDVIRGRRNYVLLEGNKTIRLDDYPSNRALKLRYLEHNKTFIIEYKQSELSEHISRFINKANNLDYKIVHQLGINGEEYYFNGKLYPNIHQKFITSFNKKNQIIKYPDIDINNFLELLTKDNNTSHIIGLFWGIASTCKDVIIKKAGLFPMLIATGQKETGKTKLGNMVCSMFGHYDVKTLNTTNFAGLKIMEEHGSFPIHFDEYGQKRLEEDEKERIKMLAVTYPHKEERGTQDRGLDTYILTCPVIITGERNIRDAGIISRSIVLNLAKNEKRNDRYFSQWIQEVQNYSLMAFMERVLCKYKELRTWYKDKITKYNRSDLIIQLFHLTYKFLVDNKFIDPGSFNMNQVIKELSGLESTKKNLSVGEYNDLFDELSCLEYKEIVFISEEYLNLVTDCCYFTKDGYVLISPQRLYRVYGDQISTYRNYYNLNTFKQVILQSQAFRGEIKSVKLGNKVHRTVYALIIDQINFSFFHTIMKYKLNKLHKNLNRDKIDNQCDIVMKHFLNNSSIKEFVLTIANKDDMI